MNEIMITATDLGINYRMDVNKNTNFKEWAIRAIKRENRYVDFWALRHISFEINKGEVVGVIGKNGAGKSTLLKAVSGILVPAEGTIKKNARVVPLLELGCGFDYELSGRENIYLNGAVLGYSKKYLDQHCQEIIDFSEIEEFIPMPLKTYSSGMIARLAFSIATMVKPDILIVDEILAVGDESFQEKSYKRMMDLMSGGTTVLYVSHNLAQIRKMCNRVLWLDHGTQMAFGDTDSVCDQYHDSLEKEQ